MAQEVLIEFLADYSSLDKGIDTLEKTAQVDKKVAEAFKATNTEIAKQSKALKETAEAVKGPITSLDQLDKKTKQFVKNFIDGFQQGINEELKKAKPEIDALRKKLEQLGHVDKHLADAKKEIEGLKKQLDATGDQTAQLVKEFEAFKNKVKETGKEGSAPIQTLKSELRQLTEEIARAKASGGPIDPIMIKRAGELKDAINDANAEISNAGSDTRGLDNIVGSISALAGGFAAVQGAVGLFTEDSEELQKVLLKVNSAMALATGIQQIANATQKEGALTKLADVAATTTQIAVQKIYTAVTGRATAATVAFKVALAATGIGLVIVGLLALNEVLKDTTSDLEAATNAIDAQNLALENSNDLIQRNLSIELARAELVGKAESDLIRIRGKSLQSQVAALEASNQILINQRNQVDATSEAWFKLNTQIDDNNKIIRGINTDVLVASINLEKQIADERKQALDDRLKKQKENNEKALQLAREQRAAEFADFKAGKELEVMAAKEGSDEQLALRKELLRAELAIALEGEKLTNNQRKVLIQQFFKDRLQLEKDFNKARNENILNEIASDINSELQLINLSNERKLELTESLLDVQAGLEIAAANGNAAKIQEIEAKKNRAILEARKASLQAQVDFEISIADSSGGAQRRALERLASNERATLDQRINAIDQLAEKEADSIQKRIDLNQELYDRNLISQEDYSTTSAQLIDAQTKVWEDAEIKRGDISERENERIKQSFVEMIEDTVSVLSEVVNTMDSLFSLQSEKENQRLSEQKQKLKDLQEAGSITEKEAITRQKRIDAEERKIKNQQAQRDKQVAVFQALLAIPSAILQGLRTGGPILAAIYGGLAAVQAGIVIARPVPKFSKGKKDGYEGPGIMGEAGAELMQRADGSFHVATKPTLVYVGSRDKIFTHTETKSMIPSIDRSLMRQKERVEVDYDKLAAAIIKGYKPAPGSVINIDKEFISESVHNGLMKTNYFDRYYSSR